MDLVLEMEQGIHNQLNRAELESLRNPVQSLYNGSSPLDMVLKREQVAPQNMINEEHALGKLSPV